MANLAPELTSQQFYLSVISRPPIWQFAFWFFISLNFETHAMEDPFRNLPVSCMTEVREIRVGGVQKGGSLPNFAVGLTQWSPPSKPIVRISR